MTLWHGLTCCRYLAVIRVTEKSGSILIKCLVVTTHPLKDSLCKLLTAHVVRQLDHRGHEVVEDLYAQQFEPALTAV